MRVLVTGAAGLFGHHVVEELISQQNIGKVFGCDDFSRGFPERFGDSALPGDKFQFSRERFQDTSVKELNSLDIDAVIHLAGYNSGRESGNTPEEYFSNNEYGTFSLMQLLSRTKNRPFFIFASTAEVYGKHVYTPVDENHPCNPENLHAVTKLAAEQHVMYMGKSLGYPAVSLRFSNTFGEYQNICGYTSVVASFIDRALRNEPLIVYGSGHQHRDFLYARDAARAFTSALKHQKEVEGKIINIASGRLTSIAELSDLIRSLTCSTSEVIELPCGKTEHCGLPLAVQKAQDLLGWFPVYSLEEGLKKTINWHMLVKNI